MIKELNRSIVLDVIRKRSPISRADIARLTGLHKATVSALVDELQTEHYLIEVGSERRLRGRRPQLLRFNARAGLVIGVDLEVHVLHLALTDLEGRMLEERHVPTPAGIDPVQTVSHVVEGIRDLMQGAPATPLGVVGVGISSPGLVEPSTGTVLAAGNLGWKNVPLGFLVREAVQLPVLIDNQARVSAMAELSFGKGSGVQNMVYIGVTAGLGGGLVVNGEIVRGIQGFAGEIGHTILVPDGLACPCGNRGCWESYASERALDRRLQQLASRRPDSAAATILAQTQPGLDRIRAVAAAADAGDNDAITTLTEVGHYLGVGIFNMISVFNPELVVVGNTLAEAGSWLLNPIQRVLAQQRILPPPEPKVVLSSLGPNAGVLGAVCLVLNQVFGTDRG